MKEALFILGISTAIAAIGWMIKSVIGVYAQLTNSINKLNISITAMNGVLLSMQQNSDAFGEGCENRHSVVDKRLNAHSERLIEHEKDIAVLKAQNK
jgi:hypothetical protein